LKFYDKPDELKHRAFILDETFSHYIFAIHLALQEFLINGGLAQLVPIRIGTLAMTARGLINGGVSSVG
jgi:hypothetical protein